MARFRHLSNLHLDALSAATLKAGGGESEFYFRSTEISLLIKRQLMVRAFCDYSQCLAVCWNDIAQHKPSKGTTLIILKSHARNTHGNKRVQTRAKNDTLRISLKKTSSCSLGSSTWLRVWQLGGSVKYKHLACERVMFVSCTVRVPQNKQT